MLSPEDQQKLNKRARLTIANARALGLRVHCLRAGRRGRTFRRGIRGLEPRVFLNLPITQPRFQQLKPDSGTDPIFVTGNPHVINFKEPHPSWAGNILVVRFKPVLRGNDKVKLAAIMSSTMPTRSGPMYCHVYLRGLLQGLPEYFTSIFS
jgi:hypothetical protein